MEKYFPFNAHLVEGTYDRVYNADDLALERSCYISDGVLTTDSLAVSASIYMDISVAAGSASIRGRTYVNTSPLSFTLTQSSASLPRIDSIVVRLDLSNRCINVALKTGQCASVPTAPELQNDDTICEIELAQIYVAANASSIGAEQITDTRKLARYPIDFDALTEEYKKDLYENLALKYDGDGSMALFDDGTYKALPNPPKLKELKRFTASGTFQKANFPSINDIYIFVMVGGGSNTDSGNIVTFIHKLSTASIKVTIGSAATSSSSPGGNTYLGSGYVPGQGASGGWSNRVSTTNITGLGSAGNDGGCIVYGFQ